MTLFLVRMQKSVSLSQRIKGRILNAFSMLLVIIILFIGYSVSHCLSVTFKTLLVGAALVRVSSPLNLQLGLPMAFDRLRLILALCLDLEA